MTSKAQKQAQARYDARRPPTVSVRLNAAEAAKLDAQLKPGEGRGAGLKRLAGIAEREE